MSPSFDDVEVVSQPGRRVFELGCVEQENDMVVSVVLGRCFAHDGGCGVLKIVV